MTFLETILQEKTLEVERRKRNRPLDALLESSYYSTPIRSLAKAIHQASPAIIAELKKASPSKGVLREDFRPVEFARGYEAAGACGISVLTDARFFSGSLRYMELVRQAVSVPVLRKDFIVDDYQVHEARAHGADAILLIVAALSPRLFSLLLETARKIGLDVLAEVHSMDEMDLALQAGADFIGINNRDLHSFVVDLQTTENLLPRVPHGVTVVSESGFGSAEQIATFTRKGVHAFLLGESLMRAENPGQHLAELIAGVRKASS